MNYRVISSSIIISAIVFFDQVTKYLVRTGMEAHEIIRVLPVLNIVNVRNRGAAFGMFSEFGNAFFIVVSLAAIVFVFWVIASGKEDYRVFSLLAAGAIGNVADRLLLGSVVDFVDLHIGAYHWPAFNVADSSLTIGIFLIALKLIARKE